MSILLVFLYNPLTTVAFQLTPLPSTPCCVPTPTPGICPHYNHRCRRRRNNAKTQLLSLHFDDFSDLINDNVKKNEKVNGEEDWSIPSSSSQSSLFPLLQSTLQSPPISYPPKISSTIIQQFSSSGFLNDNEIIQFARGFLSREEVLSRILIQDFGWKALDAHRARVGIVSLARAELGEVTTTKTLDRPGPVTLTTPQSIPNNNPIAEQVLLPRTLAPTTGPETSYLALPIKLDTKAVVGEENGETNSTKAIKPAPWKSVLVNDKAKIRRANVRKTKGSCSSSSDDSDDSISTKKGSYNYGLLQATSDATDHQMYGNLFEEKGRFWTYMTVPQTSAVSDRPIREQTAKVYMTHARLFLGWIVDARGVLSETDVLDDFLKEEEDTAGDVEPTIPMHSSPLATLSNGMPSSGINTANTVRLDVWKRVQERMSSTSTLQNEKEDLKQSVSLYDIIPTSETDSAAPILQYILWLRSERGISSNYEANILRGIIKLVKFRFAHELSPSLTNRSRSQKHGAGANLISAPSTPLDNLPIVMELRKLHREAGSKGKKAPRSSDEGKKWLDWSEYLEVIQLLKSDLSEMIDNYDKRLEMEVKRKEVVAEDEINGGGKVGKKQKPSRAKVKSLQVQRKEITSTFQQYLILSFFACVPDRQRTFRELELGRNFIRVDDDNNGGSMWVIKHTAEDYKTGSTYGERPPLPLTLTLTPEIDDFLDRWRPALFHPPSKNSTSTNPSSFLFLQPRTGNPLTANSVYQIVSRCCYKYKQKKTNPHLLRDMIVTHVRKNGDASEKELEALALFMGHSIQMQRDSYDRRTLEQKVSPAVKLMQTMNSLGSDMNG